MAVHLVPGETAGSVCNSWCSGRILEGRWVDCPKSIPPNVEVLVGAAELTRGRSSSAPTGLDPDVGTVSRLASRYVIYIFFKIQWL